MVKFVKLSIWLKSDLQNYTSFEDWLRAQELDGPLTREQRDQLSQVVRGAVQILHKGAMTLVEAFATGVGAGWAGGT